MELAAEGEFTGAAFESLLGGKTGEIGRVVLLGDVREDEMLGLRVKDLGIGEKVTDDGIGKMPGAAHHALLDVPGIRADLKHVEIVIGFEDEEVGVAEMVFHQLGKIAEVGDDGDFHAPGAEGEADGIGGIVGNRKGGDFDVADFEFNAGANVFDALGSLRGRVGKHFFDFAVRRLGEIGGAIPIAGELREAVAMVGVLVGDENGVDVLGTRAAERFKAANELLAAETGVDEESGAARFEQRGIARAARSQNGNSKGDARRSRETLGIVAKSGRGVKERRGAGTIGGKGKNRCDRRPVATREAGREIPPLRGRACCTSCSRKRKARPLRSE